MKKYGIGRQSSSVTMIKSSLLVACFPLLSGAAFAESVNLVVNGSFEDNRTSSWAQSANINGWTGFGDLIEYGVPGSYGGITGVTGNQAVEMDANIASYPSGFYQNISTQNKAYTLLVDLGARGGVAPVDNGLEVWWRGALIATVLPTSTKLQTYAFNVQGSGSQDKLEFRERKGYDNTYGGMVDNVRILDAVPYDCTGQANQLVVNGSFEADVVSSWVYSTTVTGWTHINDSMEIGNAWVYGVTGAKDKQVAEIDAQIKSGITGFYQNIQTGNKTYTLSVDLAKRAGTATDTNGVEIWWRNNLIAQVTPSTTEFKTYKFNVDGSGSSDRLEFRELAGHDESYGGLIDNVSIIDTSSSDSCNKIITGISGPTNWREIASPELVVDPIKQAGQEIMKRKNALVNTLSSAGSSGVN